MDIRHDSQDHTYGSRYADWPESRLISLSCKAVTSSQEDCAAHRKLGSQPRRDRQQHVRKYRSLTVASGVDQNGRGPCLSGPRDFKACAVYNQRMKLVVLQRRSYDDDRIDEKTIDSRIKEERKGLIKRKTHYYLWIGWNAYGSDGRADVEPGDRALRYVALKSATEREQVELAYHRFDLQTYQAGMFDDVIADWNAGHEERQKERERLEDDIEPAPIYDPYRDN